MKSQAYHLNQPAQRTSAVVFASPHSGREYPAQLLRQTRLDECGIRSSEDAFVDDLFSDVPGLGAPLLTARMPRAWVDLNRSADELDPALIEGVRRAGHNPRVSSGLGVIPRVVAGGRVIRTGKMTLGEAHERLNQCWHPYHAALRHEMARAHARFGQAILIDCHSMPHEAMDAVERTGVPRPDIVLGDRFGAAADEALVDRVEAIFRDAGLVVVRNTPFAGAFITQHYGRPTQGHHAIQVEIDRRLYMDERRICPNANFAAFKTLITAIAAEIVTLGRPRNTRLAAE